MVAFDHVATLFDKAFGQEADIALFDWSRARPVVLRWFLEVAHRAIPRIVKTWRTISTARPLFARSLLSSPLAAAAAFAAACA